MLPVDNCFGSGDSRLCCPLTVVISVQVIGRYVALLTAIFSYVSLRCTLAFKFVPYSSLFSVTIGHCCLFTSDTCLQCILGLVNFGVVLGDFQRFRSCRLTLKNYGFYF